MLPGRAPTASGVSSLGYREADPRQRGNLLREEIDNAESKERKRNEPQAHRDFEVPECQIQWHAKFALTGLLVTKHQHRQAFHCEAPHHAESVSFTKHDDVSATQDDREELERDDEAEHAMGGPEAAVGLAEPLRKNAVLGYPVQDPV